MQEDVATNLKELNRLLRNRRVCSGSWRTGRDTWPHRGWALTWPGWQLFVRGISDPAVRDPAGLEGVPREVWNRENLSVVTKCRF